MKKTLRHQCCGGALRIMKTLSIQTFLALLLASMAYAHSLKGQGIMDKEISVVIEEASLKSVLSEIERHTGVKFTYSPSVIREDQKVSVTASRQTLGEVLSDLLGPLGIHYKLIADRISLYKPSDTASVADKIYPVFAATDVAFPITGIVLDSESLPLPGASVIEKGTSNGTTTDADGRFSIVVENENTVLVFSFIGYVSHEVAANGRSVIDVVLQADVRSLEEVVVVGYGEQKKVSVTGAIATIRSEELAKVPVANTTNALAGRLPGVITKQESGEPGKDNTSINIRGFGTPLVIVDGVERSFNDINAEEIESISVLKDASAAIYGARAGNGVVLVTTKRGMKGKTRMQFKSSYSLQGVANYPGFVSSGQYAELYREAQISEGITNNQLLYSEEDVSNYYSGAPGYPNGDWWGATVRDWTPQQQHSLSIVGGTESVRFYGILGYIGQQGMYRSGDNRMDRYNVRSNVDIDVTRNLSASIDLSGKIQYLKQPTASTNTIFTNIFNSLPVYAVAFPDPDMIPYSGKEDQNPVAITNRSIAGYNDEYNNKYQATFRLNYKVPFVEGLEARGRFDYYTINGYNKLFQKPYELHNYDEETGVYSLAAMQSRTRLREDFDRSTIMTSQISLNYDHVFGDDHHVKGLLVYEAIDSKGNNFWAKREEFMTTSIEQLFASGIHNQDLSGSAWEDGRISYVSRINYEYKGKYLLEGALRYDGSNRFPVDRRWGLFPSVSAAWRISEENFVSNDWLHNLKLRTSLSQSGRDDTGMFQYLTGYVYGDDYIVNDGLVKSLVSTGVANPNITWESMTTYNVGLDFGIYNDILYGEVDVFYRLREGMLGTRSMSIPGEVGATLPAENLNSQSNRGFEVMIGHRGSVNGFRYNLKGMMSWARSRWEHYDEPAYEDVDDIRINKQTGRWTNLSYGYRAEGFFESEQEIENWPTDQDNNGNLTLKPGDVKYTDLNGDGILDWRDRDIIGKSGLPEIMYAINLDLGYKGFDFFMLWQGSSQHYVELDTRNIFASAFPKPFQYMFTDRWTPDNEGALFPRASLGSVPNNEVNSDFWLQPASYLRLKNVSIGYTFSNTITQRLGIDGLRMFVTGENLMTFSKLQRKYGFDPESPKDQNGKYYPQMRTVSVGLSLSL